MQWVCGCDATGMQMRQVICKELPEASSVGKSAHGIDASVMAAIEDTAAGDLPLLFTYREARSIRVDSWLCKSTHLPTSNLVGVWGKSLSASR